MEKMYEVGFIDFAKERVQLAHIVVRLRKYKFLSTKCFLGKLAI
ncbi:MULTISPECIES: hypothetical protein [Bacillus]|nr:MULTISPECIES: hypothetical protein [Bacillus]MEB9339914.1 hypothetical protein [Bacillus cereus]CCW08659.1 hypothetical protein EBGED10_54040 [Bacillus sp. GeD10]